VSSPAEDVRLVSASLAADPVLDVALGGALLERANDGGPAVFRLDRPAPTVSFGRLDRLLPGFPGAVAAAEAHGFAATLRVGGGRAAAIHEGALTFGLAAPVGETTTASRFAWLSDTLLGALRRLGVTAQHGQLPDEYCPGDWSLHADGVKLAGISQRVKARAAWTEGFLLVRDGARIRALLTDVYARLQLPFDPATAGALEDLLPGIAVGDVAQALRDELAARVTLVDAPVEPEALALARELRGRHEAKSG
jgi:lipoate-protein ligase A